MFTPNSSRDMADVYTSFHHQFEHSPSKRKRNLDDHGENYFQRDIKRRPTHALPFRISPPRPQIYVPPTTYSPLTSIYQQPPTPVDTSEDESQDGPDDSSPFCSWPTNDATNQDSQSTNGANSCLKVQVEHVNDVDMDLFTISPMMPRIQRARSNDIVPPHRDPNFLGAIEAFGRDRVPTPINPHFDSRLSDLSNAPRHQFPPLRTNLSPMIEQESWITRDGLPSPIEDQDMGGMNTTMLESTNESMGGLCVHDRFEDTGSSRHHPHESVDVTTSPSRSSRPARLHMGFLNGCEKCIQRVPGHYSHILRS